MGGEKGRDWHKFLYRRNRHASAPAVVAVATAGVACEYLDYLYVSRRERVEKQSAVDVPAAATMHILTTSQHPAYRNSNISRQQQQQHLRHECVSVCVCSFL